MADWIDAGRVKIIPKGEWDPNVQYEVDDIVTYHHFAFICTKDNIGIHPVDDETSEYWEQFGSAPKIATYLAAGIVKPDGETITVDEDGTIHGAGGTAESITFDNEGTTLEADNVQDALVEEYERITPKVPITNAEFEALKASGQLQRNTEYCITDLPYSADGVLSLAEIKSKGARGELKSTDVPMADVAYDLDERVNNALALIQTSIVTLNFGTVVANTDASVSGLAISKVGYHPIGIVGTQQRGSRNFYTKEIYILDGTLNGTIFPTANGNNIRIDCTILWAKNI